MACLSDEILDVLEFNKPTSILELEKELQRKIAFDDLRFQSSLIDLIKRGAIEIVPEWVKFKSADDFMGVIIKRPAIICEYIRKVKKGG